MVTFGELDRLCYGRILPKKKFNRDYILGDDEITDGSVFPLFKLNKQNPLLTINGIEVNKTNDISIEDISVCYQTLQNIDIKPEEEYFKPLGGSIRLNAMGLFSIMEHNIKDAYEDKEREKIQGKIKPIYHVDNELFILNKSILTVSSNTTSETRYVNISSTYRYGKHTKDAVCQLQQLPNIISEWKLERIVDNKITLSSNIDKVPRNGGVCDLKVMKECIKYFYKEDSNGNIIDNKKSEIIYEDITNLCRYKSLDTSFVEIVGSHVIFKQQKEGNEPRNTMIYAEYGVLNDSRALYQEGGGVVTYKYEVFFPATNSSSHTVILPTSVKCDGFVPFHALTYKFVDGEMVGKIGIPIYKIECETFNNEWCCVEVVKSETTSDGVYDVQFDIFNNNPSKTHSREFSFNIICAEEQTLKMTIVQPPLQVIGESVSMEISGETEYNADNIKKAYIDFIPYKLTKYEDDSYEKEIYLDDSNYFDYECIMSNQNLFIPQNLYQSNFNGIHTLLFSIDEEKLKGADVELHLEGRMFSKEGKFLCSSTALDLHYYNKVVIEEYEFNTDDALTYTWKSDWTDKVSLEVNSRLMRNENGEISYTDVPFFISGETQHFDIQLINKTIDITPKYHNLTEKDFNEKFHIIQEHTNDIITIELTQSKHVEEDIIVKLSVIVHADDVLEEMWSSESMLFVSWGDDVLYSMNLAPCWLYEGNNEDVIYQGYIALKTNTNYTFNTTYFQMKQPISIAKTNYNVNENISFTKEDKEVTLFIDL